MYLQYPMEVARPAILVQQHRCWCMDMHQALLGTRQASLAGRQEQAKSRKTRLASFSFKVRRNKAYSKMQNLAPNLVWCMMIEYSGQHILQDMEHILGHGQQIQFTGVIKKNVQTREADQECLPLLAICFTAEELDMLQMNLLFQINTSSYVPVTPHMYQ